jgi:DUF2938 family protein
MGWIAAGRTASGPDGGPDVSVTPTDVLQSITIGVGATVAMDLWNLFLKRTFGIPSLNYCLLGRWVSHLPKGVFRHSSISAAPEQPHECTIGWISHYSIGIMLALGFLLLVSGEWLMRPTLLPALLYGVGTILFPFFVLQPALGFGIASSRSAKPAQARLKSLATHSVFGIGLYLGAVAGSTLRHLTS